MHISQRTWREVFLVLTDRHGRASCKTAAKERFTKGYLRQRSKLCWWRKAQVGGGQRHDRLLGYLGLPERATQHLVNISCNALNELNVPTIGTD